MDFYMQTTVTLIKVNADDSTFINFWASLYRYDLEDLYNNNISVKPFTDKAISALFAWKNGGELSKKKRRSVEQNYLPKKLDESVTRAVQFSQNANLVELAQFAKDFLTTDFPQGGAIWRIFWLHCCNQQFPIYDQHVHRSMVFLLEGRIEELSKFTDEKKIDLYVSKYLAFHRRFSAEQRTIDRANYTFGRFLKAWPDLWI
jgi:hypothetical protein